ncbi:MAG: hypothetical protein K8I02_03335 [Candidatus Methylomirabilis sp.]|nr:hypothetical protein [Deltaproteobacteria bacterium]
MERTGMIEKRPNRMLADMEALHDGELGRRRAARVRALAEENEAAAEHFREVGRVGELLRAHTEDLGRDVDLSGLWTRVRHGIQTPQIDREPTWTERLLARPAWAANLALAALGLFLLPLNIADVPLHKAAETPFKTSRVASASASLRSDLRPMLINADGDGLPILYYLPDETAGGGPAGRPVVRFAGLVE